MKTTSDNLLFSLAVAITVWVVFAGGYLSYVHSERPWPYLLAIAIICIAWTIRHFVRGNAETDPRSMAKRREMTRSIVFAGLLLGVALIARLGWIDGLGEFGDRTRGFIAGAVVVFFANAILKRVSSARCLVVLRTAGWALTIGGLGYALVWLLLPVAYANDAAVLVLLFALAYATVHIVWQMRKQRSIPPTSSN